MHRILNQIKQHAALADNKMTASFGVVVSYDGNYCCKVNIEPDDVESGWLPILSPWVGDGWGVAAPPSAGDVVVVIYIEGDLDFGCVIGAVYNNDHRPTTCPQGGFQITHKSGSALRFNNDGTVDFLSSGTLNVAAENINIQGDVNIEGNLKASGDVSDNVGSMADIRQWGDTHTHTSTAPGQPTSIPTQRI